MRAPDSGLTLIEVIVVLVVAAIAAAVLAPFMGSALTRSHEPLDNLGHTTDLSSQMSEIIAEYKKEPLKNTYEEMNAFRGWIQDNYGNSATEFRVFAGDDGDFVEDVCPDPENDPECVLKVRIKSVENPGVVLTYYFSYPL